LLPQVANFESLLRRVMRRAPSAALLLLEHFDFTPAEEDNLKLMVPYTQLGNATGIRSRFACCKFDYIVLGTHFHNTASKHLRMH
jgi:hypothetical protein